MEQRLYDSPYEDADFIRQVLCLGMPVEIFYPGRSGRYTTAAKLCAKCPVREKCAMYWLYDDTPAYIGGMTPDERKKARKALARRAS